MARARMARARAERKLRAIRSDCTRSELARRLLDACTTEVLLSFRSALWKQPMNKKTPEHLLADNVRWSRKRTATDPDYFRRLSALQAPEFLWIGCSDSRVPANVITGLQPGEVFVHR